MALQLTRVQLLAFLNWARGGTGTFDGMKTGLFQNNVVPSRDTLLADLTPADFTGYALNATAAYAAAGLDSDGTPIMATGVITFTAGSPITVSNTIYGYYIVDSAGTALLLAERFPTPVQVALPGQVLKIVSVMKGMSLAS